MSSIQQRLKVVTDPRLATVIRAAASLKSQLCELNELRQRLNKELASVGKPPQPNLPSTQNLALP